MPPSRNVRPKCKVLSGAGVDLWSPSFTTHRVAVERSGLFVEVVRACGGSGRLQAERTAVGIGGVIILNVAALAPGRCKWDDAEAVQFVLTPKVYAMHVHDLCPWLRQGSRF